ncbi:unnamed protein product [Hydatigera taeniaeformis]|uniref:DNA repair protein REV1 n=1 Tax=Hydatigena taeniaeformis TaxID=6205 RepID=A0A0R3X2V9_HYDTA|nr:unnamed protein product [Hydatigera taeniaeformis]
MRRTRRTAKGNLDGVSTGWEDQRDYVNAKIRKLETQFAEENKKTSIFSGVRVYVNGYTEPPALEIRRLVQENGGTFVQYYSQSAGDFMVAANLPLSKIRKIGSRKVVKASWITESIAAGRLLSWKKFALCPSEVESRGQSTLPGVKETPSHSCKFAFPLLRMELCNLLPVRLVFVTRVSFCDLTNFFVPFEVAETIAEQPVSLDVSLEILGEVSGISKNAEHASCDIPAAQNDSPAILSANSDDSSSLILPFNGSVSPGAGMLFSSRHFVIQDALDHQFESKAISDFSTSVEVTEMGETVAPTTSDDYIRQYYSRSRLHHLSKWAADLRHLVRSLRLQAQEGNGEDGAELLRAEVHRLQGADEPTELVLQPVGSPSAATHPPSPRFLMHIDMDCFFVSVCLRNRPELVGLPVAVTHSKGTRVESSLSEVASCSYEARRFGVTNGMHLGEARKLCPDLRTVPYEFDSFYRVAEDLYKTVSRFCLQIEAISCDEMYVDVTELLGVRKDGVEIRMTSPLILGALLRRHVHETTHCTATCGFGTNRLLARLATKRAKPDGQALLLDPSWQCRYSSGSSSSSLAPSICELASREGCSYLDELPLSQLPGVGRQMVIRITRNYGVITCGQLLRTVNQAQLSSLLGAKTGQRILQLCRGNDSSDLTLDRYAKSISAEINYGVRLSSWSEVEKFVSDLAKELSSRLGNAAAESRSGFGMVGKSLTVHLLTRKADQPVESAKFLGHGICDSFSRVVPLSKPTAASTAIASACLSVLRRLDPNPCDIRGLGLQMQRLSPSSPLKNQSCLEGNTSRRDPPMEATSSITRFLKPQNSECISHDDSSSTLSEDVKDSDSLSDFGDAMSTPSVDFDQMSQSELSSPSHPTDQLESQEKPPAEHHREGDNLLSSGLLPHRTDRPLEEVNVFAKRSVDELKDIFVTWINTESDPLEEDLCMLADYLISILPTDLARVRTLLLILRRFIEGEGMVVGLENRTSRNAWRLAFRRLRLTINSACRRHYDADVLEIDLN